MKWNEDSGTVWRVQQCAYPRLAIIVISIDGGVLKPKIQVYIFRTLTQGPSVKSRTADESALVLGNKSCSSVPVLSLIFLLWKKITALGLSLNTTRSSSSALLISESAHLYATQTFPLSEFPKNKGKKNSTRPFCCLASLVLCVKHSHDRQHT